MKTKRLLLLVNTLFLFVIVAYAQQTWNIGSPNAAMLRLL